MDFSLYKHQDGYRCNTKELCLSVLISPYAMRHWELADQSEGTTKWGHRIIAILQAVPVMGGLISLIERVIVYVIEKLTSSEQLTPDPIEQTSDPIGQLIPDLSEQLTLNSSGSYRTPTISPLALIEGAVQTRKQVGQYHLADPNNCSEKIADIREEYYKKFHKTSAYKSQLLGKVHDVYSGFEFWMKGIAVVAAYIKKKKGLEGLYVCENVYALEKKVQEIALTPGDQRCALVVCTNSMNKGIGLDPSYPQHKVTVCLEKKDNSIKIALLDCMPKQEFNDRIDPAHLSKTGETYNNQELVMRYLLAAVEETTINKNFFFSQVERETHDGCTAFALHDAQTFLRGNDFFDNIIAGDDVLQTASVTIRSITQLPPDYMVGTQSKTRMDAYSTKNPDLMTIPFYGRKNGKTLKECNAKNFISTKVVVPCGNNHMSLITHKPVNQYMLKKTIQNLYLVHKVAMAKTEEEIEEMIANIWVTNQSQTLQQAHS